MTGVTGGFGAHALKRLAAEPDTRLIIGARGADRDAPARVSVAPLDLASLDSVREFVDLVAEQLGDTPIDVLVLNAGIHLSNTDRRSKDGYELTFAVNHLAHYLLARLLLPHMAEHGRLVITTSDTHDPAHTRMAPTTLDPHSLAHPSRSGFGTGMQAYTASKLCNLLTARSLADLDEVRARHIDVVAFNPGLTGGSSGRDSSPVERTLIKLLMHTVFRIVGLFRPEFVMNTAGHAGKLLADVTLGTVVPPLGQIYISLVRGKPTFPAPSELAQNRDARELLWRESAAMVDFE